MSISKLYTWNPNTVIASAEVTAEINQLITEVNTMYKTDGSKGNLTVGVDLTVTGETKGGRMLLPFSTSASSTDLFVGPSTGNATYDLGYTMNRPGSIVGYTLFGVCTSYTSNMVAQLLLQKNAATVVSGTSKTYTSAGDSQTDRATVARGTYTFSAGDKLTIKYDYTSGTASIFVCSFIEVQLNT